MPPHCSTLMAQGLEDQSPLSKRRNFSFFSQEDDDDWSNCDLTASESDISSDEESSTESLEPYTKSEEEETYAKAVEEETYAKTVEEETAVVGLVGMRNSRSVIPLAFSPATATTPKLQSLAVSKPRRLDAKTVRFSDPLIYDVQYRPRTTDEEKLELFFSPADYRRMYEESVLEKLEERRQTYQKSQQQSSTLKRTATATSLNTSLHGVEDDDDSSDEENDNYWSAYDEDMMRHEGGPFW